MLRDELRTHTCSHHERIEQVLDIRSVRSSRAYLQLLKGFYGFYAPYESKLLAHAGQLAKAGVDLSKRLKTQSIRDDLRSMGVGEEQITRLPLCEQLPNLPAWHHALGAMYVTEGSTLGSQVITRILRDRCICDGELRMTFLTGYASKTGMMWRAFVDVLNSVELSVSERQEVLATAAQTYDSLSTWLSCPARSLRCQVCTIAESG
jgi:heme oxygenase (biliverdin-IX-beta and delta-forming)